MNSILKSEWFLPSGFCVAGCLGIAQIFRLGFSRYLLVLTIVQFSLFFALLMLQGLRRSRIFPGVLFCIVLAMEVVRSWYRYTDLNHRLRATELWGSILIGALIGLWVRIRDREWDRDELPGQDEDITQLRIGN